MSPGEAVPVTVIEAGPCHVLQVRTVERDGYEAVQLGFQDKKRPHGDRQVSPQSGRVGASVVMSRRSSVVSVLSGVRQPVSSCLPSPSVSRSGLCANCVVRPRGWRLVSR